MTELVIIAVLALAVVLFSRRVGQLERRLGALEAFALGGFRPPLAGPISGAVPGIPTDAAAMPPPDAAAVPPPLPPLEPPSPRRASSWLPPGPPTPPPPPPPVPPAGRGFEEMLGTRWAVWVGGLALGLGGLFLVRYSIEQDLVGPGLRVALGLALALGLIAAGEWLRRREAPLAVPAFASANIPAVLTAAGTSTAFATVYAAYGLYAMIGPATAFLALAAISLVTMAAAVLHGPALAALGLLAALAAPLLIETRDPSPVVMVVYLTFVVGAAYGVARLRLWRWLAVAAPSGPSCGASSS